MSPTIRRRILLTLLPILPACAAFDQPPEQFTVLYAGSRMCVGTEAGCAALVPVLDSLNTPEMTARLCAAGAMTKACEK